MIGEDAGIAGHHHVVRKILPPENFGGIEKGEIKTAQFATSLSGAINTARLQVVVLVEHVSSLGREVLQTTLAE
jgi:hypothetical protein